MTNRIKTVQCPRVILVATENGEKLAQMISEIMNYCTYNTVIDDFSENTDFVIESEGFDVNCPEDTVADTVVFDESCCISGDRLAQFRERVTSYENALRVFGADGDDVLTFSGENYGADVACRNMTSDGKRISCDLIGNGILSRLSFDSSRYTVEDVLACTGVLIATGMPMASVLNFFAAE